MLSDWSGLNSASDTDVMINGNPATDLGASRGGGSVMIGDINSSSELYVRRTRKVRFSPLSMIHRTLS